MAHAAGSRTVVTTRSRQTVSLEGRTHTRRHHRPPAPELGRSRAARDGLSARRGSQSREAGAAKHHPRHALQRRRGLADNARLLRRLARAHPADGRIYVLEGSRTFSAAITSIGYLKQAGGKRVVLVGEPPGDRMMFFAEGKEVKLPHSGVTITASRQRHDYRDGCRKFDDCFAGVAQPAGAGCSQ